MNQTPQHCHDLQRVLWDQVVKAYGYPKGYEGKDTDTTFNQPHHHAIPLLHAMQKIVEADPELKGKAIEMSLDPVYARNVFKLTSTAYLAPQENQKVDNRRVEISTMVYPENTSFVTTPKKSEGEDEKSAKSPIKTEAAIPVIFVMNQRSVTRHYQENMPSHVYDGMTNRLIETLPLAIVSFLKTGIAV